MSSQSWGHSHQCYLVCPQQPLQKHCTGCLGGSWHRLGATTREGWLREGLLRPREAEPAQTQPAGPGTLSSPRAVGSRHTKVTCTATCLRAVKGHRVLLLEGEGGETRRQAGAGLAGVAISAGTGRSVNSWPPESSACTSINAGVGGTGATAQSQTPMLGSPPATGRGGPPACTGRVTEGQGSIQRPLQKHTQSCLTWEDFDVTHSQWSCLSQAGPLTWNPQTRSTSRGRQGGSHRSNP